MSSVHIITRENMILSIGLETTKKHFENYLKMLFFIHIEFKFDRVSLLLEVILYLDSS